MEQIEKIENPKEVKDFLEKLNETKNLSKAIIAFGEDMTLVNCLTASNFSHDIAKSFFKKTKETDEEKKNILTRLKDAEIPSEVRHFTLKRLLDKFPSNLTNGDLYEIIDKGGLAGDVAKRFLAEKGRNASKAQEYTDKVIIKQQRSENDTRDLLLKNNPDSIAARKENNN